MNLRFALFCTLLLLAHSVAAAAPGKSQYIVSTLFVQPNASAAASLPATIRAAGGSVDREWRNRLVVTIPDAAVQGLLHNPAIAWFQRVITGLPTATTTSTSVTASAARLAPTSLPDWNSGTYTYDGDGNITGIGSYTTFTYDAFSRLKTASIRVNGTDYPESYTYDRYGNLTQKVTGTGNTALTVNLDVDADGHNHLASHCYDSSGNLTDNPTDDTTHNPAVCADQTERYAFDPANALHLKQRTDSGSKEYYVYNANDERIAVIPCPNTPCNEQIMLSFRDEGGKVLREFSVPYQDFGGAWTWVEDYVYRNGLLVAAERMTAQGGRRHFHLDHLGTPRLVTDDTGKRISEHDYYPFGVETTPLRQETLAVNGFDREDPMKFTGHERDFTIGTGSENTTYLDYMHARSTSPMWGRFLSIDPMVSAAAAMRSPQLWNRYSYVGNNPINHVDPTGLCGEAATFVGPRLPCTAQVTLKPPPDAANWTPEQRAAENAKNAQRAQLAEEGKIVVNRGQIRPSSAAVADVNGGSAPSGSHLDHTQELVLNGSPLAKENIAVLDATVNMSNGARVRNAIAGLADGTVITSFNYTVLSAGNALLILMQGLSYNRFVQNQHAAHPGYVNMRDMERWVFTGDTRPSPPPCGYSANNPC